MPGSIDLDKLTIEELEQLEEPQLRKQVVIPLLQQIGADNVTDLHGRDEYGRDVYFEWPDVFSHRRRFGVQVKSKKLCYTSRPDRNRDIMTITTQIKQAFLEPIYLYGSQHGSVPMYIDGYYVMNSKTVDNRVAKFILEHRKEYPYIKVIDRDPLMKIIKERHRLKERAEYLKSLGLFL